MSTSASKVLIPAATDASFNQHNVSAKERARTLADADPVGVHGRNTGFGRVPFVAFDPFRLHVGKLV